MKKRLILTFAFWCMGFSLIFAQADETLMLRHPSMSKDQIAFAYASDIWIAQQDGQYPRRLTIHEGTERDPYLSSDGQWVAYYANYEGNLDVFVVPAEGGSPKRLTFHPGDDRVKGWTPDGKVIFASSRLSSSNRYTRLFAVSPSGGMPEVMPMPEAHQGSLSPDQSKTAYIKNPDPTDMRFTYRPFKRYRGGNVPRIWIFDNQTYEVEEIPSADAINTRPVWVGNTVYFLSDRNGRTNVFAYVPGSQKVEQLTRFNEFDIKTLQTNGEALVFEMGGRIHTMDLSSKKVQNIPVRIQADIPWKRPHFVDASNNISGVDLSPSGVRAVVASRGDIFTIPTDKGDIRNLTQTPGVHERAPAWSPDGKHLVCLSDASGEYQLMLYDQKGEAEPISISPGDPSFYYNPEWSPDSKKLIYTDKKMQLWYMSMADKKPILIDADSYDDPRGHLNPQWAPDSRWITYEKRLDNQLSAIFIYDTKDGSKHQITDGMSEATAPTFSRDGKYLFFAASTNYGLNASWLDMTNYERQVRSSIYAAVLQKDQASPFAPESDEETIEEEATTSLGLTPERDRQSYPARMVEEEPEEEKFEVKIDFDQIDQRIISLPIPARVYNNLDGSVEGKLFYAENVPNQFGQTLHVFDLKEKESEDFLSRIFGYQISADGKKLLYVSPGGGGLSISIVGTGGKPKPGQGRLNLSNWKVKVDPAAEWQQMFEENWRIQRDFLYDENMHGVNWKAMKKRYAPFVAHLGHREDLNYLLAEINGELVIGHNYVSGGDFPDVDYVSIGMLGADYAVENGRYRFAKIFSGLNWNPNFRAPLTEPGVNVQEGDYLLAVNGNPLTSAQNIYEAFVNTTGKQTVLTVNSSPSMEDAREVTVVPIGNEGGLRNMAWVEGNRQKVDEMTKGQVAYVYMPNTGGGGYTFFNRYYFSQLDKKAVIIDERFNGGGSAADYVIDLLDRKVTNYWGARDGLITTTPGAVIDGPKVMITNEYAASGGDLMPFLFREHKLGKLVGKRTLGILIGIFGYPSLMDGGSITAPRFGIYSKDGKWIIENEGVAPDVEVEMTPKDVIAGKDPQLEKAVELIMEEMKANPQPTPPAMPKGPVRGHRK
ncbi:MAG: PDZ domain-containing protein [Bacteroidota bacterium]